MIQAVHKMRTLKIGLLIAGLILLPSISFAGGFDQLADGQKAFNAGNYTRSFSLWSTLATQGHADAQVFVGLSYDNGWGTQKSARLARVWYQKAADNNNSSGQYLLGLHYIQGSSADRAKGLMWLKRAAENGDISAQEFLQKGQQRGWFKGITPTVAPTTPVDNGDSTPETNEAASQTVAFAR